MNQLFEGCIGKRTCRYLIAPNQLAWSFITADIKYYFDWVVRDIDPTVTQPPRRSRHTELANSSRHDVEMLIVNTDCFNNVVQRYYDLPTPIIHIQRWKLMLVFCNESINLDIVEKLSDEEVP